MRPAPFELTGQELLTADSRLVKVSIGGEYRVANPALFVAESSDASSTFDLEVRQALRNAVGELTSSNFLTEHAVLPLRIKELLVPRATQLGIDLMQIQIYEAAPRGWLDEA
jgi:regulator of protease activity HflC (stomatin/prohibitin superfamily)